ncbi:MAG: acyl-CoA dehydrogenase family protein, partial [Myxococcota bacterium]
EAGFFLFGSTVRTGGALYGLGATALAGLGHAGWGLGVAQRALDEIAAVATGGRVRMGAAALVDQQVFQRDFGEHGLALRAVRLLVHDVYGRALERLRAGDPLDKSWNDELMATVAYLTQVAEAATLFAYRAAGSQGLRNPSCVQRCFRDMFTGGLHVYVDRRSYEELARGRLAGN